MKSLGQIAFEAYWQGERSWQPNHDWNKHWIRSSKAVAREVRRRMKKGRK